MAIIRTAYCPMCHRKAGRKATGYIGKKSWHRTSGTENYWERVVREHDPDFPFGLVQETHDSQGKGAMTPVGNLQEASDAPEFYPAIKAKLLLVIDTWLQRGWITPQELISVVNTM